MPGLWRLEALTEEPADDAAPRHHRNSDAGPPREVSSALAEVGTCQVRAPPTARPLFPA